MNRVFFEQILCVHFLTNYIRWMDIASVCTKELADYFPSKFSDFPSKLSIMKPRHWNRRKKKPDILSSENNKRHWRRRRKTIRNNENRKVVNPFFKAHDLGYWNEPFKSWQPFFLSFCVIIYYFANIQHLLCFSQANCSNPYFCFLFFFLLFCF